MLIKKITRFISLTALFLIPIFPLIVANSFFFPFITGKAFYFRILVEIAFASWLILAFLDAKYRPKLNALTVGVTIFALVTLAADLLGANPLRSLWSNFERMEGWIVIAHLWMFFIATTGLFGHGDDGRKMWQRWFNVELGTAMFIGFYSLFQLAGILIVHQGSTRIDATLGNAAYMAVYMLINVGIAIFMLQSRSPKQRWNFKINARELGIYWVSFVASLILAITLLYSYDGVSPFFTAVGAFASSHIWLFLLSSIITVLALLYPYMVLPLFFSFLVYETATRGTILGLIGGIMLACLLFAVLGKKEKKSLRWSAVGTIILLIVIGVSLYAAKDTAFVKNHGTLNRLASISWSEAQGQARNYIWPMAVKGAMERPILGWGQENFNYIFNANYDPKMWNQEQWFDRAHSVFLDWLTASGLVGLLAYLSLYILFLLAVWKSSLTVVEKSALTGLIAGYAIHNIFVFDNLASYVLFFAMLGLVASFPKKAAIAGGSIASPVKVLCGDKVFSAESVEYVAAPIVIIALVAGIYFLNIRPIQANTRLIAALQSCSGSSGKLPDVAPFNDALSLNAYVANQEIREQLLSCAAGVISAQQIPVATKQAFFSLASDEIKAQISKTPKDARIYTLAGSFLNNISDVQEAESMLEKAHLLSPSKQSIDLELAMDYINTGKSDKAVSLLEQAYRSAPDNTSVKNAYAMSMVFSGREAEARSMFNNDPEIFNTQAMAQAYTSLKQYDKAITIYKFLIGTSTDNVNLVAALAQTQYTAGMSSAAVVTLQSLEKSHPELKDQIEATIKQIQK